MLTTDSTLQQAPQSCTGTKEHTDKNVDKKESERMSLASVKNCEIK